MEGGKRDVRSAFLAYLGEKENAFDHLATYGNVKKGRIQTLFDAIEKLKKKRSRSSRLQIFWTAAMYLKICLNERF